MKKHYIKIITTFYKEVEIEAETEEEAIEIAQSDYDGLDTYDFYTDYEVWTPGKEK